MAVLAGLWSSQGLSAIGVQAIDIGLLTNREERLVNADMECAMAGQGLALIVLREIRYVSVKVVGVPISLGCAAMHQLLLTITH